MNTQMMMLIMLILIVALGMWQSRRMKTMVHCTYTSSSNQTFDKLVRELDGWVMFEGKSFPLLPQYGVERQWDKGLSSLFPTKIRAYFFRWNSLLPVDPKTGEPAMITPEFMNRFNQRMALVNYSGSQQQALSTVKSRLSGLDKWMPFIMIGLAIAIAYCIYMVYTMQSNDKVTQQAIIDIYGTFNKMNIPVGK